MTEIGKRFKFKEPLSFGESRAEPTLKFYAFRLIIDIRVTLVSSYLTKKTGWPLLESLSSVGLSRKIPNDHIMDSDDDGKHMCGGCFGNSLIVTLRSILTVRDVSSPKNVI